MERFYPSFLYFQNGKFTVVGTYDGRCMFYETEQLKYFTQINVRSTRGKNAKGRKITGIEPLPGEDKVIFFFFFHFCLLWYITYYIFDDSSVVILSLVFHSYIFYDISVVISSVIFLSFFYAVI